MMKESNVCRTVFPFLVAVLLTAVSCSQDPIFYTISTETAPIPPLIAGSPSNMVVFERQYADGPVSMIYVASGRLHWYASPSGDGVNASWNLDKYPIDQPEGTVIALAATTMYMYALCLSGHGLDTALWRIGRQSDDAWEKVTNEAAGYPVFQSIYADSDRLFVGAAKAGAAKDKDQKAYAILYQDDDNNSLKLLKEGVSMFSGAVEHGGVFYLCTKGSGIWKIAKTDLAGPADDAVVVQLVDNSENGDNERVFMGMVKLDDGMIIAVERGGGALYDVETGSFKQITYTGDSGRKMETGGYATGALALWEGKGIKLLIAGTQGNLNNSSNTTYTHGYVEFELTGAGSLDTTRPRLDPGSLQSVDDNDRYRATIGKHPINHLFQAPAIVDQNRIFFAATQTAGLWSYKDRTDGGLQWNAEQ